jgi:N-acyl-D-amino-acid deacylase
LGKVINLYDILIQGGYIIDGSGAPWYRGDIAIKDGIIAHIGKLDGEQAKKTIKVDGLVVAPGFIDIHSHDDLHVLENPLMDAKIRQGVTSTVIGNCGFGLYPV